MMLEIESISVGYNALPVLKNISIRIQTGQLVAVVGPNGAGKSTLFKTISGLLKPSTGSLRFEGQDIGHIPASRRPHLGIAHVPEGRQVFPSLTVLEKAWASNQGSTTNFPDSAVSGNTTVAGATPFSAASSIAMCPSWPHACMAPVVRDPWARPSRAGPMARWRR